MTTEFHLRPGRRADFAQLGAIERDAAARLVPWTTRWGARFDPTDTLDTAALERARRDALLVVATAPTALSPAEPVGFACAWRMHGWLWLKEMSVHPAFGRRGIGRALLTWVTDAAAATAIPTWLTTLTDVPFNRPFYETHGFQAPPESAPEHIPAPIRAALRAETALFGPGRRTAMRFP